jgi:hypothetical protein
MTRDLSDIFPWVEPLDSHTHLEPQPEPEKDTGDVWLAVIDDMRWRREQGINKYGTTLGVFNGRDSLVDAYQEALDLCVYLKQRLIEDEISVGLNPFEGEEDEK